MRIAVEAHALSQENITGVGNVVLHYLNELQKIDNKNEYFIYSMDDLKHLVIQNNKWRYVDFQYALKKLRMRTRERWLELKSKKEGTGALTALHLHLYRISKILLEIIDEVVFSFKLASSLKKHKISVYLGTSTYFFPYFFFKRVKKAGFLYDLVWKLYPGTMEFGNRLRMRFFTLRNMRKIDLLVSISVNTKKDAHRILNLPIRIEAIPLAADKRIFYKAPLPLIRSIREKYGIKKKYILSVCTLEPRKNLIALISAYMKMKGRNNYMLVLTGMAGWIGTDFFNLIENSDIKGNVVITGYIANAELAPLYSGADLFVFPSLYEGFGLPVLEAMQCGCPVITSNSSSIPEVAGDAALMIDPENEEELISAMERVLKSSALKQRLSEKGLRRSKLFSWEKSAAQLLRLLESLK
jgi:glycosyltransferase involved in cell wall biosynthesis